MKEELGVPADMYLDKTPAQKPKKFNIISSPIAQMREARRNDTTGTFDADKWVIDNLPNLIRTQIPSKQRR